MERFCRVPIRLLLHGLRKTTATYYRLFKNGCSYQTSPIIDSFCCVPLLRFFLLCFLLPKLVHVQFPLFQPITLRVLTVMAVSDSNDILRSTICRSAECSLSSYPLLHSPLNIKFFYLFRSPIPLICFLYVSFWQTNCTPIWSDELQFNIMRCIFRASWGAQKVFTVCTHFILFLLSGRYR
jgi:hypothetical protein